jgi:CBS domain-containing protein
MKSTVKDIMTKRVVAVHVDASFKEMASRLRQERVSAFPVIDDDGKVIGVVSEADLLPKETLDAGWAAGIPEMTAQVLHPRDQEKAESVTAADLMTQPAVTAASGDTVEHAARVMYVNRVKRLPVVDAQGHLVGIVSRADVLSVFERLDVDIRKEITDEMILNELHTDPDRLTVTVNGGIVTLAGSPETAELGHAIVARTRHVQGVVAVRDRLDYPVARPPLEPTAGFLASTA